MGDFFHSYVFFISHFSFLISHFSFYFPFFWRFAINIVFLRQDKGDAFIATSSIQIDIVQIIGGNE